jgi:plastocyanin
MHSAVLSGVAVTIVLAACGGGGGNGGTQPPPTAVFTSLTVSPANPTMVETDTLQLSATPRDQNNAAMTGLPAATFALEAGTSVSVSTSGRVIALDPGASTVRATLTSGGTTHTATSMPNVSALGTTADVTASGTGQTFDPRNVKIAVNGRVTWSFPGPETHNVTFATPPTGGNIGNKNSGSESRTFSTVGQFTYQCTLHSGMSGEVNVRTP